MNGRKYKARVVSDGRMTDRDKGRNTPEGIVEGACRVREGGTDEEQGKVLVAVYGTLMRGERNEYWAREAGARVVAVGTTTGYLYDTGGGFPVALPGETTKRIAVEVLEVDGRGLAHMDVLEGYPQLYGRDIVKVSTKRGGKGIVEAMMYRPPKGAAWVCLGLGGAWNRIRPNRSGIADWRRYRAMKGVW